MLREIGIVLFLASVGIDAGANFVQTVVEGRLLYVGCGFLITVIPLLIIGAIARLYYKVNYFTLMGLIAGSNTDPSLHGVRQSDNIRRCSGSRLLYCLSIIYVPPHSDGTNDITGNDVNQA